MRRIDSSRSPRRCLFSGERGGKLHKDAANPAVGIEPFPEKKRRRYVHDCGNAELAKAIDAEDNEFARTRDMATASDRCGGEPNC